MSRQFFIQIPSTQGNELNLAIRPGDRLFLLGANGTGKSSLVTRIFARNVDNAKRISAHRQTWFSSNTLNMTPETRSRTETNVRGQDASNQARFRLYAPEDRASMAIFDLIDADAMLARRIADLVRAGEKDGAEREAQRPAPLAVLNEIMAASNMPIEISVEEGQKIMAQKNGGEKYSVAELSDGERNAFLIAADVLTAKPDSLIVIDEPERHLHRSIVTPLLRMLFDKRIDCAFAVSTHDLHLPVGQENAITVLIRGVSYLSGEPQAWDFDLVTNLDDIDEGLKVDLLGARRKVLFVEGTSRSLDAPIYAVLFPGVSVIPRETCKEVELAVRGLAKTNDLHWVKVWGIIDRDQKTENEVDSLRDESIFALPFYSVEALYYHPITLERMARTLGFTLGFDEREKLATALNNAFREVEKSRDHLVSSAVERSGRRAIMSAFPSKDDVSRTDIYSVHIDFPALLERERETFKALIDAGNWLGLLERYPLRQSGALTTLARGLGLQDRRSFEQAVMKAIIDDASFAEELRSLFGTLSSELQESAG